MPDPEASIVTDQIRYGLANHDLWAHLVQMSRGSSEALRSPLWSMTFAEFRQRAQYPDGDRGLSGAQAFRHFVETDVLDQVGAQLVFAGDVEQASAGAPAWNKVLLVRYPNPGALVRTLTHPDIVKRHSHKQAGVRASTVLVGSIRDHAALRYPTPAKATKPDPAVISLVLWQHGEPEAIESHLQRTKGIAARFEGRAYGWFETDGALIHNHDPWDEIFIGQFPSAEHYLALQDHPVWADSIRLLSKASKRYVELLIRPTLNTLVVST